MLWTDFGLVQRHVSALTFWGAIICPRHSTAVPERSPDINTDTHSDVRTSVLPSTTQKTPGFIQDNMATPQTRYDDAAGIRDELRAHLPAQVKARILTIRLPESA